MTDRDPPKLPLLIKLMGMTGSSNDSEALSAMRKANALLSTAGWTWERLLLGKVTVVNDPFNSIPTPDSTARYAGAPQTPQRPQPTPPPSRRPQPQYKSPPPPPQQPSTLGFKPNKYPKNCYCCGTWVNAGAGTIFKPQRGSQWEVACDPCNRLGPGVVPPKRAAKQKPSADTLLNGL